MYSIIYIVPCIISMIALRCNKLKITKVSYLLHPYNKTRASVALQLYICFRYSIRTPELTIDSTRPTSLSLNRLTTLEFLYDFQFVYKYFII